jgi:mRNA-degrading endonuclease YafQ of YafQ-DinJ toxin-antitoxin module
MQDINRFILTPFKHPITQKVFNNKKYYTKCDKCLIEIGFRIKSKNSLCGSCCAKQRIKTYGNPMQGRKQDSTKFRNTYPNVDYSNFILKMNTEGKNKRFYKMTCMECGNDRGYKIHTEARRSCLKCHAKRYTKKTKEQKNIYNSMKANINVRFKHRNLLKQEGIFRHLPYTIHDLIKHLESQFEPWMNWENHGLYSPHKKTWQIDHIKPDSAFIYSSVEDKQFIDSWSLDNLQPLESLTNILKSNK